jgi:hypothetical protein
MPPNQRTRVPQPNRRRPPRLGLASVLPRSPEVAAATREELQRNPLQLNPEALAEKKTVAVEVLANNWRESMHRFSDVLERIAQQGKVD